MFDDALNADTYESPALFAAGYDPEGGGGDEEGDTPASGVTGN